MVKISIPLKGHDPMIVKNVYRHYRDEIRGVLIVEDKKGVHLAEVDFGQLAGEPKVVD